ncbi:hypothetical protein P691DRAFT_735879 [Macrolepiota fuliginosa MF-IS2]|uniref:Uncharacterized protein n=1 Tax=Macrolepiota fuliginosa MF-IS2 TaxID=1400762 RepID=A0A9P5X5C7_9AGAR|nr:hypothetical protein P691DRAFT_735879 [Macrolepiota fuliginosa MF-IS2]
MSFPPGTFYVYMECDRGQYLVAFPSRGSADQFWRVVQKVDSRSSRRHHSQYFSVPVLPNKARTEGWNPDTCFVHPIPNDQSVPIAPPNHHPDNMNGGKFFVRSTIHPDCYWYYNPNRARIEVSRTHQTKFTIQRKEQLPSAHRPNEDILIGDDDVVVSFEFNGDQEQTQITSLTFNQWGGTLMRGSNGSSFKFEFFEGGFCATYPKNGDNGGPVYVASGPGNGERWEFVA